MPQDRTLEVAEPLDEEAEAGPKPRPTWPAHAFFVSGAVWLALVANNALGPLQPWAMSVIAAGTVAAFLVSLLRFRPPVAWPWWCFFAAMVLFTVGGLLRVDLHTLGNLTPSRSPIPDMVIMPGYGLLTAGLFGLSKARSRGHRRSLGVVLEGLMAAFAIMACAWVYILTPVLHDHRIGLAARFMITGYPPMSLFLVVVTLRILFGPGERRSRAYWYLVGAVGLMFVGDILYLLADTSLIQIDPGFLNIPYGLAFLSAGACVMHPSMAKLTDRASRQGRQGPSSARVALVGASLVIPAVLSLQARPGDLRDRLALFGIILALTAAAILRIAQALIAAQRSESRLAHQALHDGLTGLPNRRLMQMHLSDALEQAQVDETHVAVLYLDLDRFKLVNDSLGHSHGDELLVAVANRLELFVRPSDLVTRIGGDEFMIVLGQVVSASQSLELANRLRLCLREPFPIGDTEFHVSASIGVAFATGDDRRVDAEVLIRDADTAMYQAKDAGRDAVALFDESMRTRVFERVEMEQDLRHAVERRQLHLLYQPIVELPYGPVVGFEALVRWTHPRFGVLSPVRFIPVAEECGMIGEIGQWVLGEALRQLAVWRSKPGLAHLTVAVNLSAAQLHEESLVEEVSAALERTGLPGQALCLELTESVVMDNPDAAAAVLANLRRLDLKLAIDDFGTEYSSLAYLHRFPVNSLKIDKAFVSELLEQDSSTETLIAAIVAMANALGVGTVAEGVETAGQAERLSELGVGSVQGYYYSVPVRADQVRGVLRSLAPGAALDV